MSLIKNCFCIFLRAIRDAYRTDVMGYFPGGKVFLVEDDAVQLACLAEDLRSAGLVVETYRTAEAFLGRMGAETAGCVVVDVRLPGLSGVDLIQQLAARNFRLSAIAFTGFGDGSVAVAAKKAGAARFVEKPIDPAALACLIRDTMEDVFTPARLRADAEEALVKLAQLSRRERQVLDRVALGFSIKEIGFDLNVSPKSVETYRARLAEKLETKTPSALMRIALLASMLDPAPSDQAGNGEQA